MLLTGSAGSAQTIAEGISAAPIASVQSQGQVQAMKLLGPDVGWVLAGNHLLFTGAGGSAWDDITPNWRTTGVVDGVEFLDETTGWVLLHDSAQPATHRDLEIAATVDSGMTWTLHSFLATSSDSLVNYSGTASIQFLDSKHGWIMLRQQSSSSFSHGTLFATGDGGCTWSELPTPPLGDPVQFVSMSEAWMAGGPTGHQLFVTRDAAKHWEAVQIPEPQELGIRRAHSL
jgi:photosystem II stability/assembly factor-like uncharacterized protein